MRQINKILDKVVYLASAISSISFFVVIILAIISRYIFKTPILASIELSRLLFIWSCFLAAALTYRRRAHVSITYIFDKLPQTGQKILTFCTHLLVLLFMGIIFYQSIIVTYLLWPSKLPMLQITQSWFYLPVPISSLIIFSFTLEFIWDDLFTKLAEV